MLEFLRNSPVNHVDSTGAYFADFDNVVYFIDWTPAYSYGRSSPRVAYANGCFRVDRDGSGVISTIDTTDSYGSKIYTNLD